jgi:hypothetical protein
MSNRYNINLINTKTGESRYHQLFGNNDWFDTFKKYLNSIGANTDGEWVKETKIPDYKGEPIIIGNLKPKSELTISWD